ncbi:hypothetical protein QUB02_12345 [Microcoleus sp. D3_18_C1]
MTVTFDTDTTTVVITTVPLPSASHSTRGLSSLSQFMAFLPILLPYLPMQVTI